MFNLLNELVEENYGFIAWEKMLEAADCDGIFIEAETYPDELVVDLVVAASELTGVPAADLLRTFGEFMAPAFAKNYPVFFENQTSLKSFLLTVDRVIHVEVRKLYAEAHLPEFDYRDELDDELTMLYRSPRKLCHLAEGLIAGCAKHFDQAYELKHDVCMHKGAEECQLEMRFS